MKENKKSTGASKVLQLLDKDFTYTQAVKKVLAEDQTINAQKLEEELNRYI
jgi:hypothetical protein